MLKYIIIKYKKNQYKKLNSYKWFLIGSTNNEWSLLF